MFPFMFLPGFSEQEPGGNPVLIPVPGEGGQFTLTMSTPDQNGKLSGRQLPPTEFATAFLRYKDVTLEHFPEQSGELDAYQTSSYPGNAYWHYHSLFTKKAASLWERGEKVHWGVPDPVLLHAAIASQRANYCEHCQNILHPTSQCPSSVVPVTKPLGGGRAPPTQEGNGATTTTYSKAYYKGREICNNFNFKSCWLLDCKFLHICRFCQQKDHPMKSCSQRGDEK